MDDKLREFEENFSVLDRYGTDVTKEEYVTNPAIGRDNQIKELILILLTPEKSAILIGKPGIGKTAIVEGLAYRIQKGDVPDALKGYTIINIKTASLLGTMPSGESKVQKMIDELKTREKVILFVDEIHMLIGATDTSSLDFANIFKEGLGRGSIKVIGATTTEEYERYILRDKAFTRRFQKVDVPEPTRDETIEIMMGTLPKFEKQTGKKMKYSPFIQKRIMSFLVDITSEYKRVYALGSRYPDVSLTLLKQAFSYAVYDDREYMDIFDVRKAIEDTKNIYPDVKKKELPRFDKEFEDIVLEETGQKEIEPWRLDKDQMTNAQPEETEVDDSPESLVENYDQMIENQKRGQEVIGATRPKREEVQRKSFKNDAKDLDDMLLGGEIGVLADDKYGVSVPNQTVKIHKELKKQGVDDVLLSGGIGSILDSNEEQVDIQTYKSDGKVNKALLSEEGKNIIIKDKPKHKKKVDLYGEDDDKEKQREKNDKPLPNNFAINKEVKPKTFEIDLNKYMNRPDLTGDKPPINKEPRRTPEPTPEPKEEAKPVEPEPVTQVEEVKEEPKKEIIEEKPKESVSRAVDDKLIEEISNYLNDTDYTMPIDKEKKKKEEVTKDDKGDESMYGQNYGGNIDFLMGNGNPMGPPGGGNDPYNQGFGPQGNPGMMDPMGPPQGNFGPNPGYQNQGFMPQGNPGMMDQGMGFQAPPPQQNNTFLPGGGMPEPPKPENNRETLFGVPMYDEEKEVEMTGGINNNMNNTGFNQPQPGLNDPFNKPNDSFFGAPMYQDTPKDDVYSKDNDIFGQLLLPENNMRIQGGKIVDDFSDINVAPGEKMVIGDIASPVAPMGPPQGGYGMPGPMGPPQGNFGPDPGYGMQPPMGPPQGGYGMPGPMGPNYGPDPGYGMQNPGMMPQMNQPYGMNSMGMQPPPGAYTSYQTARGPVFNELKVENNLLKKPSEIEKEEEEEEAEEKKEKEMVDKIKAEEDAFVNYSDLKNGKVDQNDMSKYVSQKEEDKPVPRVDLNLETGASDEDDYLD